MPELADAVELLCSKCHKNPRADANGTNPWCKECRADYQRAYEAGRAEKLKDTGFAKGAEAMRKALLERFAGRAPDGVIRLSDLYHWLREVPTPRPQ